MMDKKKRCISILFIFLIMLFIFCSSIPFSLEKIKSNDNMTSQTDDKKEINELENGRAGLENDYYHSVSCIGDKEEQVYSFSLTEQVAYLEDQKISEIGRKK